MKLTKKSIDFHHVLVPGGRVLKLGPSPEISFQIGNSQMAGGHNGVAGVDKVINCYDENDNPIPNL